MNTILDFGFGDNTQRSNPSMFYQQFLEGSGRGAASSGQAASSSGGSSLSSYADPSMGQTTTVQKANRSPGLDQNILDAINKINGISSGMSTAATGLQDTYTDVINSMQKVGNKMGGTQGTQASTAALASGFTPFQAAGAGSSAFNNVITQLLPLLATQRQQQANVPYQLQKDLSTYALTPYQQLLAQVVSPYEQNVAGSTSVTSDPLRYLSYMAQKQQADAANRVAQGQLDIQRGQLAEMIRNNNMTNQLDTMRYTPEQDTSVADWLQMIQSAQGGVAQEENPWGDGGGMLGNDQSTYQSDFQQQLADWIHGTPPDYTGYGLNQGDIGDAAMDYNDPFYQMLMLGGEQ